VTSRRLGLSAAVAIGAAAIGAAAIIGYLFRPADDLPDELANALYLRSLPANRWVKYHEETPRTWSRQTHAGLAFDTRRGSLLVFGSDTHGENWDNSVHEFHPLRRRWETHYRQAAPETYRADRDGRPIAGDGALQPWAMHVYDTVEYHPQLDALVVAGSPMHNPRGKSVPGVKSHPTWLYDLERRTWSAFPNNGKPAPVFFGGAVAYDDKRRVLVGYKHRLWEMDLQAGEWRQASAEGHHDLHHAMVHDSRRGDLYVFGSYARTNEVWRYRPGGNAGEQGAWQVLRPGGDPCPPYTTVPVAFDASNGVFLLVVDLPEPSRQGRATAAATYVYDPEANTYARLAQADREAVAMNYMMAWDRNHRVFFLVTGRRDGVVTVWALRLQR
jgi:hypothetical protein